MSGELDPRVRQTIAKGHLQEDLALILAKSGRGVTAKIGKKDMAQAEEVLHEGYFRQFRVRTEDAADALPEGSVILDGDGMIFCADDIDGERRWWMLNQLNHYPTTDIHFSALVVYVPIPYAPD